MELTPKFKITNRITSGLTLIERARGFLEAATLSEKWLGEMSRRALVLQTQYPTPIEGAILTLDKLELKKPMGDKAHLCDFEEALSS